MLKVYSKTHWLCKAAIVTRTSFVTCSRPGGASKSEREKWEWGGVHQLCQRGHARGEDSRGRAGGGAQNGDIHRDQPQCAIQLSEFVRSITNYYDTQFTQTFPHSCLVGVPKKAFVVSLSCELDNAPLPGFKDANEFSLIIFLIVPIYSPFGGDG